MDEDSQYFKLKWNNHCSNFITIFEELYKSESLTDVSLSTSDGPPVKCHKMVLAACSTYFHDMFIKQHPQDPTVCLLHGIKFEEIKAILDYVYTGECNVKHTLLPKVLEVGRELKIKGLVEETQTNIKQKEPEYVKTPTPPPNPTNLTNGATHVNGGGGGGGGLSPSPSGRSSASNIPLYAYSPVERHSNLHLWNAAFPTMNHPISGLPAISGHQPPPRTQLAVPSSSYEATDVSPLSRKKQLASREMPILRDVLGAKRDDIKPEPRPEQFLNGNGSPHDSERRNSGDFAETTMAVDELESNINGLTRPQGRAERGRSANTPKNAPEWKRYKQYTREDIQSAMSVVKEKKMSALQAARKYGVPSRTLYDKLKKAGILPSRGPPSRRENVLHTESARFPYPTNDLNGSVYGNSRDVHSEGDSDTPNGPLNDSSSIYSAMILHAAREQQATEDVAMDMSTSTPSPSSSRYRSDSLEDQVEDLSVNRVPADVMSRPVSTGLDVTIGVGHIKNETDEHHPSPPA